MQEDGCVSHKEVYLELDDRLALRLGLDGRVVKLGRHNAKLGCFLGVGLLEVSHRLTDALSGVLNVARSELWLLHLHCGVGVLEVLSRHGRLNASFNSILLLLCSHHDLEE